jgi:hypothetical protein
MVTECVPVCAASTSKLVGTRKPVPSSATAEVTARVVTMMTARVVTMMAAEEDVRDRRPARSRRPVALEIRQCSTYDCGLSIILALL